MSALLSVTLFLPLAGALVALALPGRPGLQRWLALAVSLLTLAGSVALWMGFDTSAQAAEFQFVTRVPWVESLGISYHVGLDGVALLLLALPLLAGGGLGVGLDQRPDAAGHAVRAGVLPFGPETIGDLGDDEPALALAEHLIGRAALWRARLRGRRGRLGRPFGRYVGDQHRDQRRRAQSHRHSPDAPRTRASCL